MRNTKAFKTALGDTLQELARRGVTVRPGTVADTIERNMTGVAQQLGTQPRSAWRYFDAAVLADTIARQVRSRDERGAPDEEPAGAPMPPVGNPELALVLGSVPDALAESGGDPYAVIVNAWMAGRIHGEDGCAGCEGARGPAGHDWQARMDAVTAGVPGIDKWFDRDVWTAALHDAGYTVTRR